MKKRVRYEVEEVVHVENTFRRNSLSPANLGYSLLCLIATNSERPIKTDKIHLKLSQILVPDIRRHKGLATS